MKKINFVRNAVVVEGFTESPKPLFKSIVDGYFIKPTDTEKVLIKSVFSGYDKVFTNWCAFGTDPNKKPAKVPWNGLARRPASSDNSKSWVELDIALALANTAKINGLGIFLNGTDLTVIDVDHIKEDGSSKDVEDIMDLDIVKFILNKFNSYTEISPSGKGLHIFLKGKVEIPEGFSSKKNGEFHYNGYTAQFEVFDGEKFHKSYNRRDLDKNKKTGSPRFMTISGLVIDEDHKQINPLNKDEFIEFAKECGNIYVDNSEPVSNEYKPTLVTDKDDDEIIKIINSTPRMLEFMNPDVIHFTNCAEADMVVRFNDTGYVVEDPKEGDTYSLEYNSPSEYDAALMGKIAFLTRNPDQMINIFKLSDYYKKFRSVRDKYKVSRNDYWSRTVEGALGWSNSHPEANPFMYLDVNYLTNNLHNGILTDKVFLEYMLNKGILTNVRCLTDVKYKLPVEYDDSLGCWNLNNKNESILIDKINAEVDRLINIIEVKRAKDYEELQKKIAAVEAKGEKWEGARELPKDPVYGYLVATQNIKGVTDILNYIKKATQMAAIQSDFDKTATTRNYLNFEDCKLNLDTGEFEDHSPEDMISKSCCFRAKDYINTDGSFKTDGTVQKYLHDFFTPTTGKNKGIFNKELYDYFITAVGVANYGSSKEKCAFFLKGPSNTGKSVLMDSIGYILGSRRQGNTGSYFRRVGTSFFTVDTKGGNNDALADCEGVRWIVASEMGDDDVIMDNFLKMITGNDQFAVMRKYEGMRYIDNIMTAFIETNKMPTTRNSFDSATYNRIKIIECMHVMKAEEMDKDLRDKLIADKGGWLWLFKTACDKYRLEGFHDCEAVKKAVQEYRESKSRIIKFVSVRLDITGNEEDYIETTNDLFCEWKKFLVDEYDDPDHPGSSTNLVKGIIEAYSPQVKSDRKRINGPQRQILRGVRYKPVESEDPNSFPWGNEDI